MRRSSRVKKVGNATKNEVVCDIEEMVGEHALSYHDFEDDEFAKFRSQLLGWFQRHRRRLPWRGDTPPFTSEEQTRQRSTDSEQTGGIEKFFLKKSLVTNNTKADESSLEISASSKTQWPDPYGVWVSEVMLQQTRVATVIDYYQNWMKRFPTIRILANSSIEDVHKVWSGLGYYRRAKFLLEGARFVCENLNAELPTTLEDLLQIPGVGPYTAGAISSIAFGERNPAVDGNVVRVFSRLRGVAAAANDRKGNKLIARLATEALSDLSGRDVGDFNQALMELGACVCTPLKPACSDCPVRQLCHAANPTASRTQSLAPNERACDVCCPERQMILPITDPKRYPIPKPKKTPREETVRAVVIEFRDRQSKQGEFFMRKRAENQVLANQWDFLVAGVDDDVDELVRQSVPLQVGEWRKREIGSILHIFSHIRMTLHISHVVLKTDKRPEIPSVFGDKELRQSWISANDAEELGLSTMVQKVLRAVVKFDASGPSTKACRVTKRSKKTVSTSASRQTTLKSFFGCKNEK